MAPSEVDIAVTSEPSAELDASPRLFDNPLLDKLSRVPWWTPLAAYAPLIVVFGWLSVTRAPAVAALASAIIGYGLWSLTEYLGHRFLFHAAFPGKMGARIHFLIHGVHHVHPNDRLRLVMPLLLSGPILTIAFLVGWALFGPILVYPAAVGFILGYLGYDLTHYYLHNGRPRGRIGQGMQRSHMLHHFRDTTRGFGVSVPWMDHVFRTAARS